MSAGPFSLDFFVNTAILGFLGCFFYYLCLYYGYAQTRATEVLIIQYLWPGLTALLAVPLLREKLSFFKLLGIGFGLLSAFLVITQGHFGEIHADSPKILGIVFLGALGFSLFSVLSKKTPKIYPNLHVFMYFVWATLFSAVAMGIYSQFQWPSQDEWLPLGLNGALINGLSYLLWIKALNQAQASRIAPLVYLAPVLSVCWISLWFDEAFKTIYLVAITLAIASGVLVSKPEKPRKRSKVAELSKTTELTATKTQATKIQAASEI